jgi:rhamnose transport system permease protein
MKVRQLPWDLLVLGGLLVFGSLLASFFIPGFLDFRYLLDSSTLYVEAGILALAMSFVIVTGNIDLSIGSNMVLSAVLAGLMLSSGMNPLLAASLTCVIGTSLGLLNGALVVLFRLPSFLVTLATLAIYRGTAQAVLGPKSVPIPKEWVGLDQSLIAGIPWPTAIFVALAVLSGVALHRTVFGRWVFAVGTNEEAAVYAGLPVDRVKVLVFGLAGLAASICALLIDSRLGVARHDLARGLELDAITIAVVGGCAIRGGKGSIPGTILALLLVMLIRTAMGVANVKAEYQLTAIGLLLVVAVGIGGIRSPQS